MNIREESYDVVVCGGGMSGCCAALAAARNGANTCLIQNRPVLGGNASSEIRVTVHGAATHHAYARETGIVGEILRAERRTNHLPAEGGGWTNSVFDLTLYDLVEREPKLTLHLNTEIRDVEFTDGRRGHDLLAEIPPATNENGYWRRPAAGHGQSLAAVRASISNAETELRIKGSVFIDCTGDALPAHLAGCEWRMGSESRAETGEIHAPAEASPDVMGSSIHIRCVDTGRPSPFHAPDWAMRYEDASFFYEQGRKPNNPRGGFWWLEIGVPWDTIHDNETIRHELTRHALGVWDWMKNRDPNTIDLCRNYALDFIGQVPGKRESRRIMGLHFLTENDLQARTLFPDEVAYGGWFIDLHTPGGLLAVHSEPSCVQDHNDALEDVALKYLGPYGIPLRALISKDVPNLMMAGRNLSASHAALGTVRVMATCGLMGQAAGTAAALAAKRHIPPGEFATRRILDVQQILLREGCHLPNHRNTDPDDLARAATLRASSSLRYAGQNPKETDPDPNLRETDRRRGTDEELPLDRGPCLWFFLDGGPLDRLSLHLRERTGTGKRVRVRLRKVGHIWSYGPQEGEVVWHKEDTVPASHEGPFTFTPRLERLEPGCYRLEIDGPAGIAWRKSARHATGICAGHRIGSGKYHWTRSPGEFAVDIAPPQSIYGPEQVVSGVTRPRERSHLWIADARAKENWIELEWERPVSFNRVHLAFPAQLLFEIPSEPPHYIAPLTAQRYRIQVESSRGWETLHHETDNRESRRVHDMGTAVHARKIRLWIDETHGNGSAGLAEMRVYLRKT